MRLFMALLLALAISRPVSATPSEGGFEVGSVGLPRLLPLLQVMSPKCLIVDEEHIFFDYRSDLIKPISYPILDEWVRRLKIEPKITRLLISGHTDHSEPDAMELSWQRVAAVMAYLLQHGVEPWRLKLGGYGFQFPRRSNDTPDNRAGNRRVGFTILEPKELAEPRPPRTCPILIHIRPAPVAR